jgi:hypothetical protein
MRPVRVLAVLVYVAAVLTAATEAGDVVAFLVGVVGAACLALAYVADEASAGRPTTPRARAARRHRRRA